jgi:hypothetical protein
MKITSKKQHVRLLSKIVVPVAGLLCGAAISWVTTPKVQAQTTDPRVAICQAACLVYGEDPGEIAGCKAGCVNGFGACGGGAGTDCTSCCNANCEGTGGAQEFLCRGTCGLVCEDIKPKPKPIIDVDPV